MLRRPWSWSSSTISNIFSSKTTRPIKAKFYAEPPCEGGTKVCINGPGNMTKVAAMSIYSKNLKKYSLPVLVIWALFRFISVIVWLLRWNSKLQYIFLAFFASSFRVTEEDWLSETAVWLILFLLNVSTALKGTRNYIFIRKRSNIYINMVLVVVG